MLHLSPLAHTWILDVDGTLVKHNGYKLDGEDTLLPGVRAFFDSLPKRDTVILLTARTEADLPKLKEFLARHGLRYNQLIGNVPVGERILVNDDKPSGLVCAYACCKKRDEALHVDYQIHEDY